MAKTKEHFPELIDYADISGSAGETIETATPSDVEEIHFPSSPAPHAALMSGTSRSLLLRWRTGAVTWYRFLPELTCSSN